MRKQILKIFTVITLVGGTSSCGESFLETDYYKGVDVETGLNSVNNIKNCTEWNLLSIVSPILCRELCYQYW